MNRALENKIKYSIDLIKKAEYLALKFSEEGFYLAFSGGKDSQVLYHLSKESGVKFTTHMNLTSVDPPEVIRFVKNKYPDVKLIKPKISIFDMAIKKHILPTMKFRWCCAEYKETSGEGRVTLIGIRRSESVRRSKRNELEISKNKLSVNFDQFSEHEEKIVSCVNGKDKVIISPILNWSERDVWDFIRDRKLEYCKLYDEGYKRIGCILCPMSSYKQCLRDTERYPHVKQKWINTIKKLTELGYFNRSKTKENTEIKFDWWISKKSYNQFYSDEFLQGKIDFKE